MYVVGPRTTNCTGQIVVVVDVDGGPSDSYSDGSSDGGLGWTCVMDLRPLTGRCRVVSVVVVSTHDGPQDSRLVGVDGNGRGVYDGFPVF